MSEIKIGIERWVLSRIKYTHHSRSIRALRWLTKYSGIKENQKWEKGGAR
ncbi:hypothetical protein [Priestia endophytica]|nr:hypothetical protein [Priestia endophytica]MCY8235071.1 hypothetical protein [Priestia endophytica]